MIKPSLPMTDHFKRSTIVSLKRLFFETILSEKQLVHYIGNIFKNGVGIDDLSVLVLCTLS